MWEAAQWHWHAYSEHTVAGKQYPLELHIVHTPVYKREDVKDNNGYLYAVLGIFFDDSDDVRAKFDDWELKIVDDFFDSL